MKYSPLFLIALFVVGCGSSSQEANAPTPEGLKESYSSEKDSPGAPKADANTPAEANKPAEANAPKDETTSSNQSKKPLEEQELEEPKFEKPKDGEEVAVIETKFGKIVAKFRADKAKEHVANFKKLANKGFYNQTIFHRVIPGFMIQGGDPNTKDKSASGTYGQGGPGYAIIAEFNNLDHKRGVLSMARSGDPNSAGSQFFVCVADSASLNKQYTAFGEVVEGMDVADKIVAQPRNSNDLPDERIEMKVSIKKWPVK
jgi:peptidyl-prolyl cis-trans isomerase B (cyclophilin B)